MDDSRINILAVDDQPDNLLALETIFDEPDLKLVKAYSGQEALKCLFDGEFAVILMDAHMPEMDGFETAKIIRSRERTRATPIIFLTAMHKDQLHAAAGYNIGAVDYLSKPLVPEILKAKVQVFVELFKKTKEIHRQAKALEAYKVELEGSLRQIRAANEELRLITQRADEAREQALSSSRFKSEFLANMSHEIRTPMNGILGMIEILLDSGLTERQAQYARTAREAGRSLISVINDILDLSKIEAGMLRLNVSTFDPVELIEGIAELLAPQAHQKNLSLLTYIANDVPTGLRGDLFRIRQIITNLAGNAIKFSEFGEVIILASLVKENDQMVLVSFSVTDRGIGLTEPEIDQVFQPFVQPSSASTYGGTGLGLSISKNLAELMGGSLSVLSRKDEGSTFTLSVPLERCKKESLGSSKGATVEPNLHLLVVDDEEASRLILHSYLSSWGFRVDSAANTNEAMIMLCDKAARSSAYPLVLIDLLMPGANGLQLGRLIRENESLKDTKLILLTAVELPQLADEAVSIGFNAHLSKPVKQSILLNTILDVISKDDYNCGKRISGVADSRTAQTRRSELLLVVEDHSINQEIARMFLQKLGFDVHIAKNGIECLKMMKETEYSLIFMDCQMPELDGLETTKRIRHLEIQSSKHMTIVAMTAHAIEGSREECIAAGMDDYISKPISPEELKGIIDRWLPSEKAIRSLDAPLDLEGLAKRYGEENIPMLLDIFLKDMPLQLEQLRSSIRTCDEKKLLATVHALFGNCAAMFAVRMKQVCFLIQQSAQAQDWDMVSANVQILEEEYLDVLKFKHNVRSTLQNEPM